MRPEFVQLDRTFTLYAPDRDQEELAQQSYLEEVLGFRSRLTWNDIRRHGRVIILGEAGSGKTWEFEAQVDILSSVGEYAFFVRLEELAENRLLDILPNIDLARYQQWNNDSAAAFFFLDAVDESRLKSFHAFEQALRNFSRSVGPAVDRTRVVISARVTQWRGTADQMLVENYLSAMKGATSETDVRASPTSADAPEDTTDLVQRDDDRSEDEENQKPATLVVVITPLAAVDVQKFVANRVDAPEKFVEAIDRRDAWEFVRRPSDVEDLIVYWNDHGTLGTLSELQEFAIGRKLEEQNPRLTSGDPLPPARAREGAETLAAAVILSRRLSFTHPEGVVAHKTDTSAVEPRRCLPGWKLELSRIRTSVEKFFSIGWTRRRPHSSGDFRAGYAMAWDR